MLLLGRGCKGISRGSTVPVFSTAEANEATGVQKQKKWVSKLVDNGNVTDRRYVQIGTLHGSVVSCQNSYPGIYARLEDPSIFGFLKSNGEFNGKMVYNATTAGNAPLHLTSI